MVEFKILEKRLDDLDEDEIKLYEASKKFHNQIIENIDDNNVDYSSVVTTLIKVLCDVHVSATDHFGKDEAISSDMLIIDNIRKNFIKRRFLDKINDLYEKLNDDTTVQ